MKLFGKKFVAFILCAAIAFGIVPGKVNAQGATTENEFQASSSDNVSSEVIDLREENTKHFDMGNGVYQAVTYSHPVHEMDSNGNWQDIDFGLTLTGSTSNRMYCNKAAGAAFAEKYEPNQPIMRLSAENNSISMTVISADKGITSSRNANVAVTAEISTPQNSFNTFEEAKSASFSNTILYKEVLPGVDLEYIVDPGTVKENIIVKEKATNYQYAFSLDMTGLYPVMQKDGSILVYDLDTDAVQYEMPAPFMYDALGNISEAVAYSLSRNGNTYTLTVTADKDWINAKGRCFPIMIDPSYVVSIDSVDDTYIDGEYTSNPHGAIPMLWVRFNRISYIKTATPNIPSGAQIQWASLCTYYYYNDYMTSGFVDVEAHRVTFGDWDEYALTWDDLSDISNYGLGTEVLHTVTAQAGNATVNNPAQADFLITNTFKDWIENPASNHGIGLKYGANSTNLSVIFVASEASYDYRPRITYRYTHYADNVYKYIHYYDSTFADFTNYIPTAVAAANIAYNNQFGIYVQSKNSATYLGTLTDACEEMYMCSSSCAVHHKNLDYIAEQLDFDDLSGQERVVYWTDRPGNTYCIHDENGYCQSKDVVSGGAVIAEVRLVNTKAIIFQKLLPYDGTNEEKLACMGINLIHETAHTMGLNDRYFDYDHDDIGYQCVMESYITRDDYAVDFYNEILSGEINAFCTWCEGDLAEMLPS